MLTIFISAITIVNIDKHTQQLLYPFYIGQRWGRISKAIRVHVRCY